MSDPHVFTLKELGGMYFPLASQNSQSRQLKRWIELNRPLTEALEKCGYQARQRYLTPKQVAVIFEYLGEP